MQRPKRKTTAGRRASISAPERQHGRHAPAPLFDLADLGAQDFDVRWGPRGLDGTLGLAFRVCSQFVLQAVSGVKPGTCAPSGYVSRALTPEASLDLGSNFIELRFWEIRRPRLGGFACPTSGRLADRGGVSFAISGRHCGHKIRITGGNSPVLAGSIGGW